MSDKPCENGVFETYHAAELVKHQAHEVPHENSENLPVNNISNNLHQDSIEKSLHNNKSNPHSPIK